MHYLINPARKNKKNMHPSRKVPSLIVMVASLFALSNLPPAAPAAASTEKFHLSVENFKSGFVETPPSVDVLNNAKKNIIEQERKISELDVSASVIAEQLKVLNVEISETQSRLRSIVEEAETYRTVIAVHAKSLYIENGEEGEGLQIAALFTEGSASVIKRTRKEAIKNVVSLDEIKKVVKLESEKETLTDQLARRKNQRDVLGSELKLVAGKILEAGEELAKLEAAHRQISGEYTQQLMSYGCYQQQEALLNISKQSLNSQNAADPQNSTDPQNKTAHGEVNERVQQQPPVQPISGWSVANAKWLWDFFTLRGFTPESVAGILGNLQQESNLNPTIKQHPTGPGRGLAQWSTGGRWDTSTPNLIGYATQTNANPWALKTQAEFIYLEMSIGWGGFDMEKYRKMTDTLTATEYFHRVYERSADTSDFVKKTRGGYADKWYQILQHTTPAPPNLPTPPQGTPTAVNSENLNSPSGEQTQPLAEVCEGLRGLF